MAQEKKGISTGFKIAIAAVVIIGLSVGGYFIYDYTKPKAVAPPEGGGTGGSDKGTGGSGSGGGASSGGSTASGNDSFPLKRGSEGANVAKLQAALNRFYRTAMDFTPLDTDGAFGGKTEAALKRVYGVKKTEAVQGDIDWLNSHSFKPKSK
jgi:hypothetical protein